jgi:hypothetical protein
VNINITDNISAFLDAVGIFSIQDDPRGNFWNTAATERPYLYSPLLPLDRIIANPVLSGGADLTVAKTVDGSYILGGSTQFTNNVYGNMMFAGYDQTIGRTATFNNGVNFDLDNLTEGLSLKTYMSFDIYNTYHQLVQNTYAVYEPVWYTYRDTVGGNVIESDSIRQITQRNKDVSTGVQELPATGMSYTRRIGAYALLDYNRKFGSHTVTGTFLAYHDRLRISDLFDDVKHSHLGLRIGYNFENKIFVDFSSAYVNGFKLPEGNKGGFSPSIGLAWVLTEDLLSGGSVLSYLKLKASAGMMNSEFGGTDNKLYERTYLGTTTFINGDGTRSIGGTMSNRSANPDLTFEKMKNFNFGIEAYLFNNALQADVNIFTAKNTGELVQRVSEYPSYLYLNVPYENYEETGYSGGELGLVYTKTFGDLTVNIGTNLSYAKSKALVRSEVWGYDYLYREGKPQDAMFGYEAIGFFRDSAEILASPVQTLGITRPGDIKYKDQNGDGTINQNDQIEIGNSTPRLYYGVYFNLKYKNLGLFAFGNGQNGSEAYYSGTYFRISGTSKYSEEVLDRWTPETATTATYPRLTTTGNANNSQNSTFWLYEDNYFRLDRIQLTVDMPGSVSSKLYTKALSFYLRGENLVRFSEDAEKRQLIIGAPPLERSYAIGAKLSF